MTYYYPTQITDDLKAAIQEQNPNITVVVGSEEDVNQNGKPPRIVFFPGRSSPKTSTDFSAIDAYLFEWDVAIWGNSMNAVWDIIAIIRNAINEKVGADCDGLTEIGWGKENTNGWMANTSLKTAVYFKNNDTSETATIETVDPITSEITGNLE